MSWTPPVSTDPHRPPPPPRRPPRAAAAGRGRRRRIMREWCSAGSSLSSVGRSTFGLLASSSDPFRLHIYPLRSGETANVVVVVDPARRRRPPSRRLSSARPQHRRFRSRSSGVGSEKRNKWFLCTLCDLMEGGDGEVGERPLAFQRTLNKISATNDGVCTRGEAVSVRQR